MDIVKGKGTHQNITIKIVRQRIKWGSAQYMAEDNTDHGQRKQRQTEDGRTKESRLWLHQVPIKRETESLITAAREQALHTN